MKKQRRATFTKNVDVKKNYLTRNFNKGSHYFVEAVRRGSSVGGASKKVPVWCNSTDMGSNPEKGPLIFCYGAA